jgi:hypothetical protein
VPGDAGQFGNRRGDGLKYPRLSGRRTGKGIINEVAADGIGHLDEQNAHLIQPALLLQEAPGQVVPVAAGACCLFPGLGAAELLEKLLGLWIQRNAVTTHHENLPLFGRVKS